MAWTTKGIYVHTIQELFKGTTFTGGWAPLTSASWKIALLGDTATDGASPVDFSAVDTTWVNTQEVTGGANWATGGRLLSTAASAGGDTVPTLAEGTTGSLRYDHTNDVAVSSTTTTAPAKGCIIYDDACSSPADLADAMLVAVNFGATFSTVAGIFGIQWSATGIFEIDLTP